jgi:DNA modification methylase
MAVYIGDGGTVRPVQWHIDNQTDLVMRIKTIADGGDIILDIFGSSGITLMAAEQTGRTAHLLESDPRYCDAIALRFAKMQRIGADIFLLRNGNKIPYNEI